MSNTNTPKGLSAVRRKDSAQWDNTVYPVFISSASANAIATGDVVSVVTSTVCPSGLYPAVDLANLGVANNATFYGVVDGFVGTLANATVGTPNFWNTVGVNPSGNMSKPSGASTVDYYALVSSDTNLLYKVQVSNTDVLPLTAVGKTANLEYAAPNAYTGLSATTLNANSIATSGGEVVIYGFAPDSDPTSAYAKVLVYFNKAVETGI